MGVTFDTITLDVAMMAKRINGGGECGKKLTPKRNHCMFLKIHENGLIYVHLCVCFIPRVSPDSTKGIKGIGPTTGESRKKHVAEGTKLQ